jgi:ADP-ribose pyrophosphatase YjhB (NUDIX family)
MRRKWKQYSLDEDDYSIGHGNIPEWWLVFGSDYKEFSWQIKDFYHKRRSKVDLEVLLEEPRVDLQKRKSPTILFIADTINLLCHNGVPSASEVIRRHAPRGYNVLADNRFVNFYSDFYSGIDDALPAAIISTEDIRAKNILDDEGYYVRSNLEDICRRRKIPFLVFPGGYKYCQRKRNRQRIADYLDRTLPGFFAQLPRVDSEHYAKVFGINYPIGEFNDRGRVVRLPYAVLQGERIPIIASTTLVIKKDSLYLMMQEAKKGSGDKRVDVSKWSFPGGKLEEGEVPHEAVLRELQEETPYKGIVHGLVGLFSRVNANGRLIMKATYFGGIAGSHTHPLAEDSLGCGFFDEATIRYFRKQDMIKTSDQLDIIREVAKVGLHRQLYKVSDIVHPGAVRMLRREK